MDDPDEGGDILESDFHGSFKGSLEFNVYSCNHDSQVGLFAAFADCPLGYDTIRIDVGPIDEETVPADVINRLISRCSNTLELLEIKVRGDRICKPGPAQP